MEFFLFSTDPMLSLQAEQAGIDSIVVDWETRGKDTRQKGYNLETNHNTDRDVALLASTLRIPVTVRVNPLGDYTVEEVELALAAGARVLMLPMAASVHEVERFLSIVGKRARTIIQIETLTLADEAAEMRRLAWDYAYIGLNDLMVARGGSSIWEAVVDGTAETICEQLRGRAYGFGGSTILGGGEPIMNIFILHELVRLGGSMSLLRRTFKKELLDRDMATEIGLIRQFIACSERRGELARAHDHERLRRIVAATLPEKKDGRAARAAEQEAVLTAGGNGRA